MATEEMTMSGAWRQVGAPLESLSMTWEGPLGHYTVSTATAASGVAVDAPAHRFPAADPALQVNAELQTGEYLYAKTVQAKSPLPAKLKVTKG